MLYGLFDPGPEKALTDRMSFRQFCGFDLCGPVEGVFGTLKQVFGHTFARSCAFIIDFGHVLRCTITFNLRRAVSLTASHVRAAPAAAA